MDNIYTFWYKLLPTYLNTLNYETHSEPQKKKKKKKNLTTLRQRFKKNNNVHDNSGIYGLTCVTRHLNYVGQTSWSLNNLILSTYNTFDKTIHNQHIPTGP